jgi:hypothetical protein
MRRLERIAQAQFFERTSALGKVDIFAIKPKRNFIRSGRRLSG